MREQKQNGEEKNMGNLHVFVLCMTILITTCMGVLFIYQRSKMEKDLKGASAMRPKLNSREILAETDELIKETMEMFFGVTPDYVVLSGVERSCFIDFVIKRDCVLGTSLYQRNAGEVELTFKPKLCPNLWQHYCHFKPEFNRSHHG